MENIRIGRVKIIMNYKEISELLQITGEESPVFMPNKIFSDLQGYLTDGSHLAFTYSYVYLVHFLYRNCKYFNVPTELNGNVIKEILGYKKSNRTMNYITKKDGLLDSIGYTHPTKNYPTTWAYVHGEDEKVTFDMYSDLNEVDLGFMNPIPKTFFLKAPLKALETRVLKSKNEDGEWEEYEAQGTFYDTDQTHEVDFKVFMFCMDKKDLGVIGFYLYSWLKHKNDIFGGYDCSIERMEKESGIPRRTILQYLKSLKGYKVFNFKHNQEYFTVGMSAKERKATTYHVNEYSQFSDALQPFENIPIMKREYYLELKQKENEKFSFGKVEIDASQLPF